MRKSKEEIVEFDADRVRPLANQPRKRFKGIQELADSIAEVGQMAPGIVTMIDGIGRYDCQLVDGERRLRACQIAGVAFRAVVRPAMGDDDTFVASFAANFGKQDHDCIEIAEGLDRMHRAGKTVTQLARITGRSITWVHQHLNLLKLDPDVRAMMVSESDDPPPLTFHLAQSLVPLDAKDQLALAKKVTRGDGMSVAAARRMILKFRSDAGDENVYDGGVGRPRSIRSMESILEQITHKVGVYIDMPGADFNRIVDALDQRAKKTLVEAINDVRENLADLAEAIERRRKVAVGQQQKQCA